MPFVYQNVTLNVTTHTGKEQTSITLGMSIDIRKSGYRISGPISGYENSQTDIRKQQMNDQPSVTAPPPLQRNVT